MGLFSEEQNTWLDRLEVEHDNLRTALQWSTREEPNPEAALRLASSIWRAAANGICTAASNGSCESPDATAGFSAEFIAAR